MNGIDLRFEDEKLIVETKDSKTRIVFDIRRSATTLIIDDYTIERYDEPINPSFAKTLMRALKLRGFRHVLTDELPDGLLPWCERENETLHCNLSNLT
ncbi:MAG: hypothetical protein ACLFUQ_03720 [Candidatus Izemoplasmataceae bacterium]